MPTDSPHTGVRATGEGAKEVNVDLTIRTLHGGGFAAGRFAGGRRLEESEIPVV